MSHPPDDAEPYVEGVIPIAGEFGLSNGRNLDPHWTRLNTSSHPGDRDREGLRLKMGGGFFPPGKEGHKQEAVVEFLCTREGTDEAERRRRHAELSPRREKDEGDDEEKPDLPHDGETTSDGADGHLKFISYDLVGDAKVLSLEWRTPHTCEDSAKDSPDKGKSGDEGDNNKHWGFFTWLIIM